MSQEHIPRSTKEINDLITENKRKKKKSKTKDGEDDDENDSSIEEPNLDKELDNLDEFESLFRVAPSNQTPAPTSTAKPSDQKGTLSDFKIQRMSKEEHQRQL